MGGMLGRMPADLDRAAPSHFAERLRPGPAVWIVIVGLAGMLTISFVPLGLGLALGVGSGALVMGAVLALATAPRVAVADGELHAGSAHIPLDLLGAVRVLDREATRHEMGPALDARAKRQYRQRVNDLRAEIDEAERWNDIERVESARTELDALIAELRRAVGIGGRDRPQGSGAERARVNVARSIRRAIAAVDKVVPARELVARLAAEYREAGKRLSFNGATVASVT